MRMVEKLTGKMDVLVAIGFGFFLAWRQNLINFLYPMSAGLVFSPLVCMSFACCLVLVLALVAFRSNQASFSSRVLVSMPAVLIVAATLCAYLVAKDFGGAVLAYAAALIIGVASALGLFSWVEMLAVVDVGTRIVTAVFALLIKALLGLVCTAVGGFIGPLPITILALVVLIVLVVHEARNAHREIKPLIMRPTSSSHFKLLLGALVVYAFIFGVTAGNTAAVAHISVMLEFNTGVDECLLVISAILLAVLLPCKSGVRLSTIGRVLTPVLAILFLLHILLGGSAGGLLPKLTEAFWDIVQVFVLLVLIDVAQSGVASLSFVFPVGWGVVSFGYACGTLAGQATGLSFGDDFAAVQAITAMMTILAVVASSVLAAAQYPSPANGTVQPFVPVELQNGGFEGSSQHGDTAPDILATYATAGAVGQAGTIQATPDGAPAVAPVDPIAQACAVIAKKCALSEREGEVLDLLARGNTRMSIAEKLIISENTVRVHVKNIYAKLHIHSKQQLIDMVDRRA